MPIRLNLLAEAQAAEEARRRDPVKRAIWIGALLVSLMLGWASSLHVKGMLVKSEVSRLESDMAALTNDYRHVLENQRKLSDVNHRLVSLNRLTTNRFLNGTLLNALQHTTHEDVQLVHLRVMQEYAIVEEIKPRTNANRVTPGKPGSSTERITLILDANDTSVNAGSMVLKFKDLLAENQYFQSMLGRTNEVVLKNQSAPNFNAEAGRPSVLFTLECRYPPVTR